jgi:Tfp pilus assembly protein PilF
MTVLLFAGQSAMDRGVEALRSGDYATAERELQQAVQEAPASARALALLGHTYSMEGKTRLAEEPLKKACSLNPGERDACYSLGVLYYELNRYEDSFRALETALRHNATEPARVHDGLALALEAMGNPDAAEVHYRLAVESEYRQGWIDYGMFLFRHGRAQEGLPYLRKAGAKDEIKRVLKALGNISGAATAPTAASGPIEFRAEQLGMVVRNGATGAKHQIETMLAGVAVFDFDNDGWPDIFVANGAAIPSLTKSDPSFHNRLFRNNHDGAFTNVTEKAGVAGYGYSMGVAAADYDNDGWTDLFVTGVRQNILYHNRGDGTFEDVTSRAGLAGNGGWSVAAGWFDYDSDGLLDLFVVRYVIWNPATEPYCGLLKPGYRVYCHPQYYEALPNALYHNEGAGRFRDVSRESGIGAHAGKGMGVAFGDCDADGLVDVFVANDTVPNFLFHNEGKGRFREIALPAGVAYHPEGNATSSMGAEFRDFDNDGRDDLFVTELTNERFALFRNVGACSFADATGSSRIAATSLPWSGWSAGMVDLNNDTLKDLFVAAGHVNDNTELTSSRASRQPNLVFVNRGGGVFDLKLLPGKALHRGAAFADFDRDGRMDVVITRLNESPLVLLNVTSPSGHWTILRLIGTRSNRDGIGARIHLESPSGSQWNRVTTSVGYAGSSDRTVHFGLGKDERITTITIEWPSGERQVLHDLPADTRLEVKEPPPQKREQK